MTQLTEQPLYPKLSPIYNKIMQLAIAIAFIVVIMNLWLFNQNENHKTINDSFSYVAQQYIDQTTGGLLIALKKDRASVQLYVNSMASTQSIKSIHVYDVSGQVIAQNESANTMNDLYGISPKKLNKSEQFVPFVAELRDKKLQGYVRITLEKKYLTQPLIDSSNRQYDLIRLMLIMAGVIGFLLTRGLNRFSRQGFRLAQREKA